MKLIMKVACALLLLCMVGIANASTTLYFIKAGDTLSAIAKTFDTSVEEILSANPRITNPDRIYAGNSLKIHERGRVEGMKLGGVDTGNTIYSTEKPSAKNISQTSKLSPTLHNTCDFSSAIEKLHYPEEIAQQLKQKVESSHSVLLNGTQETGERIFTVNNETEFFKFSYTNNCVFSKHEGRIPKTLTRKEVSESSYPFTRTPESPTRQPYPIFTRGGGETKGRGLIYLIRYKPNCKGEQCSSEVQGTHTLDNNTLAKE